MLLVGQLDRGERVLEPMRQFGTPLLDRCARRPFVDLQSMLYPSYPHGTFAYLRSCHVAGLSDDVVRVALDHAQRIESRRSSVTIRQLGGAVARVWPDETAFGSRSSGYIANITRMHRIHRWLRAGARLGRDYGAALAPYRTGVYVNFLMDEELCMFAVAYGARARSPPGPEEAIRSGQLLPGSTRTISPALQRLAPLVLNRAWETDMPPDRVAMRSATSPSLGCEHRLSISRGPTVPAAARGTRGGAPARRLHERDSAFPWSVLSGRARRGPDRRVLEHRHVPRPPRRSPASAPASVAAPSTAPSEAASAEASPSAAASPSAEAGSPAARMVEMYALDGSYQNRADRPDPGHGHRVP